LRGQLRGQLRDQLRGRFCGLSMAGTTLGAHVVALSMSAIRWNARKGQCLWVIHFIISGSPTTSVGLQSLVIVQFKEEVRQAMAGMSTQILLMPQDSRVADDG